MIIPLFFFLGLFFWLFLAISFARYWLEKRNLLDAVSSVACVLCCLGPARELRFLPNVFATPLYVVLVFAGCGGVAAVLVFRAQRMGR